MAISADIHEAGTADGWHGVISEGGRFPPEAGRYHLYIGLFCPWAQRVNLVRHLKGLTDIIPVSIVKPYPKGDENGWPGWCFPESDDEYPGSTVDKLFGSSYLHQVYFRADEEYKGRYSVPLLWDTVTSTVVCNESSEMLRWLPQAFDSILPPDSPNRSLKLYPRESAAQIDDLSVWLQTDLNSAVYRTGFSKIQADYEVAVRVVFHALNDLEALIYRNGGPFILGRGMTELDIRAYVTIVRFDTVYVQHFKCNLGTIRHDYPVINAWLSNIYFGIPGFQQCTNFKHIKENYTKSHYDINPHGITPLGPVPSIEESSTLDFKLLRPGHIEVPE